MKFSKALLSFNFIVLIFSCKFSEEKTSELPFSQTVIYYLYNSALRTDSFTYQLWQMPIYFKGLDSENQELYFIYPRYKLNRAAVLNTLCLDTGKVTFAPCNAGPCTFGSMEGNVDSIVPFKFKVENLKFNPKTIFTNHLTDFKYTIDLQTLETFLDSNKYYNVPNVMDVSSEFGYGKKSMNICSFISKPGDTMLLGIANQITKNCKTIEDKTQKLCDFVSTNIKYSYADFWYNTEVTKNANEVLMTGLADCSGKSTLLASLLEQLKIPYALLYYKNHMNIGVKGSFSTSNHYFMEIENLKYFQVETTVPNFKIGTSLLQNGEILNELLFYQLPQKSKEVINFKTNRPIKLLNMNIEDI